MMAVATKGLVIEAIQHVPGSGSAIRSALAACRLFNHGGDHRGRLARVYGLMAGQASNRPTRISLRDWRAGIERGHGSIASQAGKRDKIVTMLSRSFSERPKCASRRTPDVESDRRVTRCVNVDFTPKHGFV